MADKTMKIQFKTKSKDSKPEPAGAIHTLPEAKAKAYLERGLAVEVKPTADELKAKADAEKATEKAAKEAEKKAAAEAAKAAKEAEKNG